MPDETSGEPAGEDACATCIIKPAQDTDWDGHIGYFNDPDGYYWEVAWNPGLPLSHESVTVQSLFDSAAWRLPKVEKFSGGATGL